MFQIFLTLFLIAVASQALAEEEKIQWYGFLTAAVTASDQDHPYATNTTLHPNYEKLSKLGLNLSRSISPNISLAAQVLAVKDDVILDWAFASIRLSEWLTVRVGRQKFPVWFYSDKVAVGRAYNWVTPPEEVYRQNPIDSINGVTVSFYKEIQKIEANFDIYGGNFHQEFVTVLSDGRKLTINAHANDLIGANLLLSRDWLSFRSGAARAIIGVETEFYSIQEIQSDFWSLGLMITKGRFEFISEYANLIFKTKEKDQTESTLEAEKAADKAEASGDEYDKLLAQKAALNAAVNNSSYIGGKTGYAMVAWQAGDFKPHLTFSKLDSPDNSFIYGDQYSVTTGVKYDINLNTDLKFEWHKITIGEGSWGLYSRDNNNPGKKYNNLNVYSAALDYQF